MTYGRLLQTLREKRQMTQQQLADAAGLSVGTVRHHEQGLRLPTLTHAAALARALDVSVDVLTACDEMAPPVTPPDAGGGDQRHERPAGPPARPMGKRK